MACLASTITPRSLPASRRSQAGRRSLVSRGALLRTEAMALAHRPPAEVVLPLPEKLVLRSGLLQLIAAEAQIAALEAALAEARDAANRDALTGLLNRRGLAEAHQHQSAQVERGLGHYTLALLDLDDFKQINDQFGHAAGDAALVHLGQTMRQVLRPTDSLCRIGGEEFALLLAGTDPQSGVRALERLRAVLAETPVSGIERRLCFSAGLVAGTAGASLEQLLAAADQAVYRAKAAGKNCTQLA